MKNKGVEKGKEETEERKEKRKKQEMIEEERNNLDLSINPKGLGPRGDDKGIIGGDHDDVITLVLEISHVLNISWNVDVIARAGEGAWNGHQDRLLSLQGILEEWKRDIWIRRRDSKREKRMKEEESGKGVVRKRSWGIA